MKKYDKLITLIKENPELEVMPMVATECVDGGDDYRYWAAQWGETKVAEYYSSDERIYFKSTDIDVLVEERIITLKIGYNNPPSDEILEEKALKMVENLNWIKAIIVIIDEL